MGLGIIKDLARLIFFPLVRADAAGVTSARLSGISQLALRCAAPQKRHRPEGSLRTAVCHEGLQLRRFRRLRWDFFCSPSFAKLPLFRPRPFCPQTSRHDPGWRRLMGGNFIQTQLAETVSTAVSQHCFSLANGRNSGGIVTLILPLVRSPSLSMSLSVSRFVLA